MKIANQTDFIDGKNKESEHDKIFIKGIQMDRNTL